MSAARPVPRKRGKREVGKGPARHDLPVMIMGIGGLIAFGGGTHPLSLGLLMVILGLVMARTQAPAGLVGRCLGLCWTALFAWILLSLWLPAAPADWRLAAEHLGIPVASALSPQPWVTLEALLAFLAGSALLFLALAYKPDPAQRRQAIHWLAGVLAALGAGAIFAHSWGWRLPWADEVHVFSWFPNRNQTALTFACGSVLCFGLALLPWDRHYRTRRSAKKEGAAVAPPSGVYTASSSALLGGLVLLYALFQSLSRGALIAWASGMLALVILRAAETKYAKTRLWRVVPAAALLLFSFFVFVGGASRDRLIDTIALHSANQGGSALTDDFRWQLYADTASMIADQPLRGAGLGQFHYVFPQYRSIPAAPVALRHPESDWLWWLSELGAVGVALIVLGLTTLLLRLRAPKAGPASDLLARKHNALDPRYRHIAIAALVPFLTHSLVDVGAHRLGTVALALILYTLALPPGRQTLKPGAFAGKLWRGGAISLVLIGSGLVALTALQSPWLSTYAPQAKKPLATAPLQWQPYFRAATQTYSEDPDKALRLFYQARFLLPYNAEIPFQEGGFLLAKQDHAAAFAAFHSALQRSPQPAELFRRILRRTASQPLHHPRLYRLAQTDEALLGTYWSAMPGKMLKDAGMVDKLSADWPRLPASAQRVVLGHLSRQRLTETLLALFESSQLPAQKEIWPLAMQACVAVERWQDALAIWDQWGEQKPLPQKPVPDASLRKLQASALMHGRDPVASARLLRAYLSRGMWDEVRRTSERIRTSPDRPPDTLYWLGRALRETGRPEEAAQAYAEWLSQPSE